jgi:hypothetical protein
VPATNTAPVVCADQQLGKKRFVADLVLADLVLLVLIGLLVRLAAHWWPGI